MRSCLVDPGDDREAVAPLRERLRRLDGLPVRPTSMRWVAEGHGPDAGPPTSADIDPGWIVESLRSSGAADLTARPWWPNPQDEAVEAALGRFWRHATATGRAARRLA